MTSRTISIVVVVILVIIAAIGFYFYSLFQGINPSTSLNEATSSTTSVLATSSFQGTAGQENLNPIQNKIPATQSPTVNPLEGAYKNPFE